MNIPQVECIFCDDLRSESSGKTLMIGCYGTHMYVNALPFLIERIVATTRLRIPLNLEVEGDVLFELMLNEHCLLQFPLPLQRTKETGDMLGEFTETVISAASMMRNIHVTEPSILKVRVAINGTHYFGSKLRIIQIENAEQQPAM